ncbi:hypothetical protein MLD38_018141 [Melastoma candidum]|uniref:Uncharacterized protein n=1 Tax=Melastoma candidum TaxID=119954 RepID=A0ACB9R157_9MYRT|nr:hypothetical protein MLD38_018141 [Melastoma candidum]
MEALANLLLEVRGWSAEFRNILRLPPASAPTLPPAPPIQMKKKHSKSGKDSTPGSSAVLDLKSLIHEHSLFFDELVKLIPARFYLPTDDQERPWYQGLSNAAKASAKKEARENIKRARRERLDPETLKTTLDLLNEKLDKAKDGDDDKVGKGLPPGSGSEAEEQNSVTYEELRQRLRRRIEELRGGRTAKPGNDEKTHERKQPRENKRKRESISQDERPGRDDSEKVEKNIAEATKDIAFSHVKLGNEESKRRKKKSSKLAELERARQLEEAKRDPDKGEQISKKHSWKAATDRAAGVKVHDDPRLLNKSLQKEKRRREKNAEKWKERVESTHKMKAEKQKKRTDNIAGRIHDKKMRRIAKREKKLMRPGFEGRKEGYINEEES